MLFPPQHLVESMPRASTGWLLFSPIQATHKSLPDTFYLIIFPVVIITPSEHPECDSLLRMGVFWRKQEKTWLWIMDREKDVWGLMCRSPISAVKEWNISGDALRKGDVCVERNPCIASVYCPHVKLADLNSYSKEYFVPLCFRLFTPSLIT